MTTHDIHGLAESFGFVKDETYALLMFKVPPSEDYMTYNESIERTGADDFNGVTTHDVDFDVWCHSRSSLEATISKVDSIMDENAVWMDGGFSRGSATYSQEHGLWGASYSFTYRDKK